MSKLAWTNNELYPENKRIFIDPNETITLVNMVNISREEGKTL